jgi:uncharacterized protein (TIGR02271 family)
LHQADDQVLITFDQNQRIQVPLDMLRRREDGSYVLPISLSALHDGTVSRQREGDDNIVAVIPVVVEEARVAKRQVETGRVRIQKSVHTAEEQVDVPLLRDTVDVKRVPVERYLEKPVSPHYRGHTLVIPVMEEVLVVQKRLLLREEIHVTTVREQARHQETVTLQREQVTVTREEPRPEGSAPQQTSSSQAQPDNFTAHEDTPDGHER